MRIHPQIWKSLGLFSLVVFWVAGLSLAATLSGQVTDENNAPASDVQVVVPAVQQGAKTDSTGSYKIENLPAGSYAVEFRRVGSAPETRQADLTKGDVTLNVGLSGSPLTLAPITITASPEAKSSLNTPASVSVVEGRQLDKERTESVISAIQNEPGVNMIAEGPTVVKPVIRGLNSQDIVVVQDGIRIENLQWGNEHAPEVDSMGSDRIEVMRGPNSLLYGSDALGGVISVNHPDLPNAHLGAGPLSARFTTDLNSNNNSAGENIEFSGAQGDWGYRTNIAQIQAGNFRSPQQGYVPNTGEQQVSGSGEVGVRKDWGMLDLEYGHFDKRVELQNPSAPWPNPLNDGEYQTLQHDHGSVKATVNTDPARLDLTLGYDRADRKEFDSPDFTFTTTPPSQIVPPGEPHLNWIETSYTSEIRAHLAEMGPFQGTVGVSGLRRVEQSLGVVDLTPSYNEDSAGEYLVEDLPVGKFDFTVGVRGDQTEYNVQQDNTLGIDYSIGSTTARPVSAQTLHYSAVSGAAGGVYHITDPLAFAVNVGRGYRNPVPFELFAYGVHEGAGVFQIGNPDLTPETSIDTDASLRWASNRVKAEIGVFRNYIHDYIYGQFLQNPNGTQIINGPSGLPEVSETQGNATIKGFDGAVAVAATNWLSLKTVYNDVRGYNDSGDPANNTNYLPHVPADNVLFGADIHEKSLGAVLNPYFGLDEKLTAPQARTNASEIPTKGYALTDAHIGGEFVVMSNRITVDAGVNNLLNQGYIDYNSILKEFNIEDSGRNVYVKFSVPFGS
jgi:iron complex outermembrane receptor protein